MYINGIQSAKCGLLTAYLVGYNLRFFKRKDTNTYQILIVSMILALCYIYSECPHVCV
jgi:NhaP-type Na+/H+ or K+/H+ antiporter